MFWNSLLGSKGVLSCFLCYIDDDDDNDNDDDDVDDGDLAKTHQSSNVSNL